MGSGVEAADGKARKGTGARGVLMHYKHRYTVLTILILTYFVCHVDRMVMASVMPFIAADLQLSPFAMGAVLSAFFAGYALMQIPGGVPADRFGGRVVLTASIVCWSIMTALSGFAAEVAQNEDRKGCTTLLRRKAIHDNGDSGRRECRFADAHHSTRQKQRPSTARWSRSAR